MTVTVVSVNVGVPTQLRRGGPLSGIDKRPVDRIEIRAPGSRSSGHGSGVIGDAVTNRKHHGGDSKAVYAYAREELDWWQEQLERPLPHGFFGENLTTAGIDLEAVVIGSRWQVGEDVVLAAAGPRIPCRTFADKMQISGWVKRFTDHARAGAYFSVDTPGVVHGGAPIIELSRPDHGLTVTDVWFAKLGDDHRARQILDAGILDRLNHNRLQRALDRRRTSPG